jgi:hypothetical protein
MPQKCRKTHKNTNLRRRVKGPTKAFSLSAGGRIAFERTHNPSVGGSSPPRPTTEIAGQRPV